MLFLPAILLFQACNDGDGVIAPVSTVGTVAGTVITSATGDPVAGAEVSIGASTATTGPDGRFALTDITAGPATLRCIAEGFEDFEADIIVPSGAMTQDISLTPVDLSIPLTVSAVLADRFQGIWISRAGADVKNAVVTVNGFGVPRSSNGTFYEGGGRLAAGSPVVLEATVNGVTVEATGNVPDAPSLTAPAGGIAFTLGDSITITWTSPTDPDVFEVYFDVPSSGGFCCDTLGSPPGTARELKIAASDVGVGPASIIVHALNESSFTGPADPHSRMTISSGRSEAEITIDE